MKKKRINHICFGSKRDRIIVYHLNRPLYNHDIVGFITGPMINKKIPLRLVEDDDLAGLVYYSNGFSVIKVSRDIFYGFKRGDCAARTTLFHEIGHLVCGGHENYSDQEKYDKDREMSFNDGKILDIEEQADEFAVKYLGAEYVTTGLCELIDLIRPSHDDTNADWEEFEMSKVELERRIKRIKLGKI